MGKIKVLKDTELVGGIDNISVYPVTSTKAVYNDDNKRLDDVLRRNMPINISIEYNNEHVAEILTLSQSINKVAPKDRIVGFQGKYLSADGWHTIIYNGDNLTTWTDTTKWIDLNDKIFNSISKNATFAGIATPTTNPGVPNGPVFYLTTEVGVYPNFNNIEVTEGEAIIFKWDNGTWSKKVTGFVTQDTLTELESRTAQQVTNPEWIQVVTDREDKILEGTKTNGNKYFSLNVNISEDLNVKNNINIDGNINIKGNINGENITDKVDKVIGKSLIDANIAENTNYIQNPEYIEIKVDNENKILEGIRTDGTKEINIPLIIKNSVTVEGTINADNIPTSIIKNPEWLSVTTDKDGSIIEGITVDGKKKIVVDTEIDGINIKKLGERLNNIEVEIEIGDRNTEAYNIDKSSAIISASSRSPLLYEKTNKELCCAFSILTDLHSDINRFKRACVYADSIDEILATFCLGDMINHSAATNPYPLVLEYTKPVISITGNHEVLKKTPEGINGWSESDIQSKMFSPDMVNHNGEIHPTGKNYWYKDFSKIIDNVTKTVRVIGLHQYESNGTGEQNSGAGKDVTYYSQEQIDWLISTLDSCDANTYVMILMHYAPTSNLTRIECPFTPSASFNFRLGGGSNTGGASSMSDNEFIPKIVQAWINGTTLNISCDITVGETTTTITAVKNTAFSAHTGKFAGYFAGHTHKDFIGKLTNYPKQLLFTFNTTSAQDRQQTGDIGRTTSGKTQDCFTIVSVDWFKNSINLIRIGADVTTDMRDRKYFNIEITN